MWVPQVPHFVPMLEGMMIFLEDIIVRTFLTSKHSESGSFEAQMKVDYNQLSSAYWGGLTYQPLRLGGSTGKIMEVGGYVRRPWDINCIPSMLCLITPSPFHWYFVFPNLKLR